MKFCSIPFLSLSGSLSSAHFTKIPFQIFQGILPCHSLTLINSWLLVRKLLFKHITGEYVFSGTTASAFKLTVHFTSKSPYPPSVSGVGLCIESLFYLNFSVCLLLFHGLLARRFVVKYTNLLTQPRVRVMEFQPRVRVMELT